MKAILKELFWSKPSIAWYFFCITLGVVTLDVRVAITFGIGVLLYLVYLLTPWRVPGIPIGYPLLIFSVVGAVVIVAFGLFGETLPYWGQHDGPANWERGAFLWTICFACYYVVVVHGHIHERSKIDVIHGLLVLAILLFVALGSWAKPLGMEPIWIAGVSAIVFLVFDFFASRWSKDDTFRVALLVVDTPTVCAFSVIAIYVWVHRPLPADMELWTSGAIAFQLIASKVMFVIIETAGIQLPLPLPGGGLAHAQGPAPSPVPTLATPIPTGGITPAVAQTKAAGSASGGTPPP